MCTEKSTKCVRTLFGEDSRVILMLNQFVHTNLLTSVLWRVKWNNKPDNQPAGNGAQRLNAVNTEARSLTPS